MRGEQFAKIVEQLLAERGIAKGDFYKAIGISATALYGWKRGAEPKRDTIEAVEKYFGVDLSAFEKSTDMDDETAELLETLKDRQDLRILLKSGRDVPPSSVYALISQLEKLKEETT